MGCGLYRPRAARRRLAPARPSHLATPPPRDFTTEPPHHRATHPPTHRAPDFIPKLVNDAVDGSLIDEVVHVGGSDAIRTTKDLAVKEGILSGTSGGGNLCCALEVAKTAPKGSSMLVMLPDTGERYTLRRATDFGHPHQYVPPPHTHITDTPNSPLATLPSHVSRNCQNMRAGTSRPRSLPTLAPT